MIEHPGKTKTESAEKAQQALDAFEADGVPRELVRDGKTIAVIVSPDDFAGDAKRDIWKNYDPEKARAALRAAQGVFDGVDTEQLKRDLKAARAQDSSGRPGD